MAYPFITHKQMLRYNNIDLLQPYNLLTPFYDVLTYLCLFSRWEQRPSTKEHHCFLSVAILSISLLV